MASFQTRGATLDYDVAGSAGPLVVQLHGLTSSRERDGQLGLNLARALRDHRILRYDARGHGRSTGTLDEADYSWPRLADDLLALLDHVAPGEQVHGVGPSMGTGTLLHAAVKDPDRFESLTLVTPPTAWKSRGAQRETYLANAAMVEREGIAAFEQRGSTAPSPPALADAPETGIAVPESLLPTVMRGAAATDLPTKKTIATIEAPTLVLAWSGDRSHPLTTANKLHARMPQSRIVVARTPYGVMAWPGLFAEFITTVDKAG
ncbi:alpha/beta hydrolase [Sinomonas sp. ASV322]|uniref:alpha/beta fold hydrolase n=1 Tax=Sinomonas sp. ASV322 TaxID=3041920 RepID=UPI0027DE10AB|nr:alpha/beta hydrolase [Sinomonas sp. ASV322]MDQ4504080.1 alpha/beta hydrolase [Sinomonas sp. ASV322]